MFAPIGRAVNRPQHFCFEVCRAGVEVAASVRAGLGGELHDRDVRANMLGEPVAVHAQVVVRDAGTDPASPFEVASLTHFRCCVIAVDPRSRADSTPPPDAGTYSS